jgi:sulfite exporter TauE/SafE
MVYAALSIAIAAAHPLIGALAMLAFGAATVPGLTVLGAGVQRLAQRGLWARRAVAAVVLVLGLWSVGMRGFSAHGAAHAPSPQDAPAVHGHAP